MEFEQRPKVIDLYCLERSRERGDLMQTFKKFKGLTKVQGHNGAPFQILGDGKLTRNEKTIERACKCRAEE